MSNQWEIRDDGLGDPYILFTGNGGRDRHISVYLPEPIDESAERLVQILREHWTDGTRA